MNIKIFSFIFILIAVAFLFHAAGSQAQSVEYIENDIRISPHDNVFDLTQPRDLFLWCIILIPCWNPSPVRDKISIIGS